MDELKACIELGFGFDSPDLEMDQRLSDTFPALGFYYAVNKSYNDTVLKSRSSFSVTSPSESDFSLSSPVDSPLTMFSPGIFFFSFSIYTYLNLDDFCMLIHLLYIFLLAFLNFENAN